MRGNVVRGWRSCVIAGFATGATCAGVAWAQIEPVDPEAEQLGDEGVQVGAFVMRPRISLGALYNDNVLAREIDPEEDYAWVADGSVTFASTWRRHALGFGLSADSISYDDLDSDDEFNYAGEIEGRVDVTQATNLFASVGAAKLTEGRDSPNFDAAVAEPIDYSHGEIEAGVAHQFARTLLAFSALWDTFDYDDAPLIGGGTLDNDARDFDSTGFAIDLSRAFRAGYDGFIRIVGDSREYTESEAEGRDSDGVEGRVGVRADITELIEGQAYVGYGSRDYEGFRSVDGFIYGANLSWLPTSAWRISAVGQGSIDETNDPDAAAYVASTLELSAFRSVGPRLLLGPTIGFRQYDFEGTDRDDEFFTWGVIGRFALNRALSVDAEYDFIERNTTLVGRDYDQNRFALALTLRR